MYVTGKRLGCEWKVAKSSCWVGWGQGELLAVFTNLFRDDRPKCPTGFVKEEGVAPPVATLYSNRTVYSTVQLLISHPLAMTVHKK